MFKKVIGSNDIRHGSSVSSTDQLGNSEIVPANVSLNDVNHSGVIGERMKLSWYYTGDGIAIPATVSGLQLWFSAEDLDLSNNASVTLWNPKIDNTDQDIELEDQGALDPTYDIGTMAVPSVDAGTNAHSRSIGMRDTEADWGEFISGIGESNMCVFSLRCDDVTDSSIFSCIGGGSSSVGSSGFRGFDFRINGSKIDARRKDTDNAARTTAGITLANNTDYVIVMVFEADEDTIHLWVDGGTHTQYYNSYVDLGGKSAKPTDGNGNLLGINGDNTSWPPPIWMSDWLWYYRTDDYTNAEVNIVGSWLANRIGTTWTDVTDLAS